MIQTLRATLAACALLMGAAPALAEDAPHAAAAPTTAIPAPPPGKGQIVFFRHLGFLGAPYWAKVREHDVELGKLSDGVYFVQVTEPGVHTYTAAVTGKDVLRMQVDPDETYYVEGRMTMAVIGYNIVLAPSDEAAFQKAAKSMKRVATPTEHAAASSDAQK